MEKIIFEVVRNDSVNNEILDDYWDFKDVIKLKFKLSAKDIINKYHLDGYEDLTNKIFKSGSLLVKKIKDCNKCYENYIFYNRAQFNNFKSIILKNEVSCVCCRNKRNIKKVNKIITDISEHQCQIYEETLINSSLSYLEKIYLHVLIENYKSSPLRDWSCYYILNDIGGEEILKSIIQKGYIKFFKGCFSCNLKQAELNSVFMNNRNIFENELKNDIEKYLKMNLNCHCNIVVPSDFNDLDSWLIQVYSDIMEPKITIDDVKGIEDIIFNHRFNEVYRLISLICDNQLIPWKKDNAFDFEVVRLTKKYNLEVIFNTLNYCAQGAKSKLYEMEKRSDSQFEIKKNYIYRYQISLRLDCLEKYENSVLYSKNLPSDWVPSEFEFFVNTYIIEGDIKWSKFSPKEILNIWLGKVEAYTYL